MTIVNHFGINIREKSDGLKLTRENYIKASNKSSFRKGKVYSDLYIDKHTENCLFNFDLNMQYFHSLPKKKFDKEIKKFIRKNRKKNEFTEVRNLSLFDGVAGYYIMVLDEYKQVYIGRSVNIKNRIQSHWSRQMPFDRLIFGKKEDSILSIDSFRAYDTTRIFVYTSKELELHEDTFINTFDKIFLLNRTGGGTLKGGLLEAIMKRKTRKFPL